MSALSRIAGAAGRLFLRMLRRVIAPAIGACVVGYFAYYAVHGDRGLLAHKRVQEQISQAEQTLAEVRAEREQMEQRVQLLRSEHIDRDMLDERARSMLNLAHPDDVVIPFSTRREAQPAAGEPAGNR